MRVWVEVCVGVTLLVAVAESVALLLADGRLETDAVGALLDEGRVDADTVGGELTVGHPVVLAVSETEVVGVQDGSVDGDTDDVVLTLAIGDKEACGLFVG